MTTATTSLKGFLLARIAEEEAVARDAAEYVRDEDHIDIRLTLSDRETGESHSKRIRPWHPRRVLAECEAKRKLVDQIHYMGVAEDRMGGYAEEFLSLLALPYANHPDYRDEWRP